MLVCDIGFYLFAWNFIMNFTVTIFVLHRGIVQYIWTLGLYHGIIHMLAVGFELGR